MAFNGWAVELDGVVLVGNCHITQADYDELCPDTTPEDETDDRNGVVIGTMTMVPDGLGVPPLRTEDLTYVQRDGVTHFNDWYEPRVITLTAYICADGCNPTCGGLEYTGLTARQKVQMVTTAWSRVCCDTELVIYTDCNGTLDPSTQHPSEDAPGTGGVSIIRYNFALNPEANSAGTDSEWIERYPLKGDYTYEAAEGPLEEVGVSTWVKKEFTDTQTANDDGFDFYQSVDAAPPLGVVETLDWNEPWADTDDWEGLPGWIATAGTAQSTIAEAIIWRDTNDDIAKVEHDGLTNAKLELANADDTILGSLKHEPFNDTITLVGAAGDTATTTGTGAFELEIDYVAGTMTATAAGWVTSPLVVDFTDAATRVRLVAPDTFTKFDEWAGLGNIADVAVGPSDTVHVYDDINNEIRKYNSAGVLQWTISSVDPDTIAIAVNQSTGDVYTLENVPVWSATVKKWNSAGVSTGLTWSYALTGFLGVVYPGFWVEDVGDIWLSYSTPGGDEYRVVRKGQATGDPDIVYPVSQEPIAIALDSTETNFYFATTAGLGASTLYRNGGLLRFVGGNITDLSIGGPNDDIFVLDDLGMTKYDGITYDNTERYPMEDAPEAIAVDSTGTIYTAYIDTLTLWNEDPGVADELSVYTLNSAVVDRPLDANTQYTLSVQGYAESATSAMMRVVSRLHDGVGNWLAAETAGAAVETEGTDPAWSRASVTFTTPALPGSGAIYLAARAEWVKTDWQIGDVLGASAWHIEKAAAPSSFFSGNTLSSDTTEGQLQHNWEGVEHDSISRETLHEWEYDTNIAVNGPYGVVGRPRGATVKWSGTSKCAWLTLQFDAVDQNLYLLDDCGTPGYQHCLDLTPGVAEYNACMPMCFPVGGGWCFTNPVLGSGPETQTLVVGGTEVVYPQITLWPDLPGSTSSPIIIENDTTGEFITYGGEVTGEPVTIYTNDGTAYQGETSVTHLLGGNLNMSLTPGTHEFRVLLPAAQGDQELEEDGRVTVCVREAVISA